MAPGHIEEPARAGDIFIHTNTATKTRNVWLYGTGGWKKVTELIKPYTLTIQHPTNDDRFLMFPEGLGGDPSWVPKT